MRPISSALANRKHTTILREENLTDHAPRYYAIINNQTGEKIAEIRFQSGARTQNGVNGIHPEDLLHIVNDFLEHYQKSPHACHENEQAVIKTIEATNWLMNRTANFAARRKERSLTEAQ